MDLGLEEARILVTGGAGFIGREICRALAAEGARPVVHYRSNREDAERIAAEVGGIALHADLTIETEAASLFARIDREVGDLDCCICCAGVRPSERRPLSEMSLSDWDTSCGDNLAMVFLTAREFLRRAKGRRGASLVFISSSSDIRGNPGRSGFAAAKSAISFGLLQSLTDELASASRGGRVNAISPGWVEASGEAPAPSTSGTDRRNAVAVSALPRLAAAEDVARAAVWLASPVAAAAVTGQIWRIDAGQSGRLRRKNPRFG